MEKRIEFFKDVSLFEDMDNETLIEIAPLFENQTYTKGDVIYSAGDEPHGLYIVYDGCVQIHNEFYDFSVILPHNFFGEYSLIDEGRRSLTATATTDVEILFLNKDAFFEHIMQHAAALKGLLKNLIKRLRRKNILEEHLVLQNAEIRAQRNHIEHQREELQELIATKDKFFSIIAHDLRNPFNAIVGLSDLMVTTEHLDLKKAHFFAQQINTSARDILNLLENLLQWARSQTGNLRVMPQKYDLIDLVRDCVDLFTNVAAEKSLIITVSGSEPTVFVDVNMLRTVIRNLLSNAVKFTPDNGKIELRISNYGTLAQVEVQDSGIGMSADTLSRLFRVDSSVSTLGTRQEKGSGLGLLLVNEFIQRNGGTLSVQSTPGQGTCFSFTIPLCTEK